MKNLLSPSNEILLSVKFTDDHDFSMPASFPCYSIIFIAEGEGVYYADFGKFPFTGPVLLFSTPLQQMNIEYSAVLSYKMLQFHGDFYCIEYHKAQVSCNGLLFNSIYIEPSVRLSETEATMFNRLLDEINTDLNTPDGDESVLRAFLQLVLAKASNIKTKTLNSDIIAGARDEQMEKFARLLDQHFLELHKPNDYAELLAMTPNNFSKRCSRYFKKTPSELINERIILEAKKKLHLTRLTVKEIAYSLNFSDEFYFSRFFKKFTRVSPQGFRELAGISIVAGLEV